jgi:chitinase
VKQGVGRSLGTVALAFLSILVGSVEVSAHDRGRASKRLVGYYTSWGVYAKGFRVKHIKDVGSAGKVSHMLYAFAKISPAGTCELADAWADHGMRFSAEDSVDGVADAWWPPQLAGNFNQLQKLKAEFPNIKLLISIGGWSFSDRFSDVALTPESRQTFVASCVDMFIRGNFGSEIGPVPGLFDGIDLDWEYPGACGNTCNFRPEDTVNFTSLLAEFRAQLDAIGAENGRRYELAIVAPATEELVGKIELKKIHKYLDFINLLTYDFHGSWDIQTNFHSPLLPSPRDPVGPKVNTHYAVDLYLKGGFPAKKIDIGLPFYGRGWKGVPNVKHGLYQTNTGVAPGRWEAGVNDFRDLDPLRAAGYQGHRDLLSGGSFWIYNPTEGIFWGYDDPTSAWLKGGYVKLRGLGGAAFWDFSGDDGQLVSALRSGLD